MGQQQEPECYKESVFHGSGAVQRRWKTDVSGKKKYREDRWEVGETDEAGVEDEAGIERLEEEQKPIGGREKESERSARGCC